MHALYHRFHVRCMHYAVPTEQTSAPWVRAPRTLPLAGSRVGPSVGSNILYQNRINPKAPDLGKPPLPPTGCCQEGPSLGMKDSQKAQKLVECSPLHLTLSSIYFSRCPMHFAQGPKILTLTPILSPIRDPLQGFASAPCAMQA